MKQQPSYYAVLPANVRYSKELSAQAKLLYAEISSLCTASGYCWADNRYFAEFFQVDVRTVKRWLKQLVDLEFLYVEIEQKEGNKRRVAIEKNALNFVKKLELPRDKNVPTSGQKCPDPVTKMSRPSGQKCPDPYNRMNNIIELDKRERETALAFFKNESLQVWETFQMKYQKQINDWNSFVQKMEFKLEEEKTEFNSRVINARINRFAMNYLERQKTDPTPQPDPLNHPMFKTVRF